MTDRWTTGDWIAAAGGRRLGRTEQTNPTALCEREIRSLQAAASGMDPSKRGNTHLPDTSRLHQSQPWSDIFFTRFVLCVLFCFVCLVWFVLFGLSCFFSFLAVFCSFFVPPSIQGLDGEFHPTRSGISIRSPSTLRHSLAGSSQHNKHDGRRQIQS